MEKYNPNQKLDLERNSFLNNLQKRVTSAYDAIINKPKKAIAAIVLTSIMSTSATSLPACVVQKEIFIKPKYIYVEVPVDTRTYKNRPNTKEPMNGLEYPAHVFPNGDVVVYMDAEFFRSRDESVHIIKRGHKIIAYSGCTLRDILKDRKNLFTEEDFKKFMKENTDLFD